MEILRALGSNHALKEKELEIRPRFPFSELPRGENHMSRDLDPIEPENTQGKSGWNPDSRPSTSLPERDVDEDRTKKLESALKIIWRDINPSDTAFEYYPFTDKRREYSPCRRRGRFVSPKDSR